jgi:hypothetical protein
VSAAGDEVPGPAETRNQVTSVHVRIDAQPSGGLRISSPYARGWARHVRTRDELVRAVAEAFREAQIASYARWRGEAYDHDAETDVDNSDPLAAASPRVEPSRRALAGGRRRTDVHDPREWTPLENGDWRAPSGRVFRADSDAVRKVRTKLEQLDTE